MCLSACIKNIHTYIHVAMATQQLLPLLLLALTGSAWWHLRPCAFSRRSLPPDFVVGTASSAYQIEGAADRRGRNIWDTFIRDRPGMIVDGSNASVSADSYHRYKEDVRMMKQLGVDAYRFSISWSRILPDGKVIGGISKDGVRYYNNLVDELKSNGLEPYVTLYHWDLPQALEDEYEGFLGPQIVDDFQNYADLCFSLYGDRVKHWITLNEPWSVCREGYTNGTRAPGRCSPEAVGNCSQGDSYREPYIAGHHMLLAHAATFKLYREKYQASQKGTVGISLNNDWFVPYSNTKEDMDAATRQLDFFIGWFLDPLTQGDYPFIMRALVGDRLPQFTAEQSEMVKGAFDFVGINYYSTYYVQSVPLSTKLGYVNQDTDAHVKGSGSRNGIPIGPMAASDWLFIYPDGLRRALLNLKHKYNNPPIYITENGVDEVNNPKLALENALKDEVRIDFFKRHLEAVHAAIRDGVNVKGYFGWSLLDNFEWNEGYTVRFGFYYVDFKSLQRYPKSSALWFSKFLKK